MIAELRLILLALSLVLLAGIWWWGARRAAQAPGNSALREPTLEAARHELAADEPPQKNGPATGAEGRDWGVPPFEPLSIRIGEYDRVPILDGPMMVNAAPTPVLAIKAPVTLSAAPSAAIPTSRVPTLASENRPVSENSDRIAVATSRVPNASEQQKIISIRVCAPGEVRWSGAALLAALELHGLAYGRYQVFHRKHMDGRSLFCVASLVEPGTFDVARMSTGEFRGVTMFAVLPGPVEPLLTVDELLTAARGLAGELSGMVQDAKGLPLSAQRAAALRDDVARFQASLPGG